MNNPTLEEINKVLAEFEGHDVYAVDDDSISCRNISGQYYIELYTKDLNLLVPIWEKLGAQKGHHVFMHGRYYYNLYSEQLFSVKTFSCETIQQAAAVATYHAVKALGEEK